MRETVFGKLERQGFEQGLKQGVEQGIILGMQQFLSRLLQAKFGTLNQEIIDRVQKIESEEAMANLVEKAITASSLDELELKLRL